MEPNFYYRGHSSPPLVSAVARSVRSTPLVQFLKIHLNVIFQSMPSCYTWSASCKLPHHNPVWRFSSASYCHMAGYVILYLVFWFVCSTNHQASHRALVSTPLLHSVLLDPNIFPNIISLLF